ncbi:hypothetical protein [Bacillus thuringiensis]|uniref:hypothetical protein n=1 Tax=Bacillus thuringiensis TaxID=1428 RepID=UPI0011A1F80E|nr:hypothetical protein [Bacillus thuringiensis]
MLIENFVVSRGKGELRGELEEVGEGRINDRVESVVKEMDGIVLKYEGGWRKEFLRGGGYKGVEVVLCYVVEEGFWEVCEKGLREK